MAKITSAISSRMPAVTTAFFLLPSSGS